LFIEVLVKAQLNQDEKLKEAGLNMLHEFVSFLFRDHFLKFQQKQVGQQHRADGVSVSMPSA